MQVAIAAARRAEGRSGPNPPVGCAIISSDGQLIAVGHTASGGRPHAETEALAMAGAAAQGATAYVTLEPVPIPGRPVLARTRSWGQAFPAWSSLHVIRTIG